MVGKELFQQQRNAMLQKYKYSLVCWCESRRLNVIHLVKEVNCVVTCFTILPTYNLKGAHHRPTTRRPELLGITVPGTVLVRVHLDSVLVMRSPASRESKGDLVNMAREGKRTSRSVPSVKSQFFWREERKQQHYFT